MYTFQFDTSQMSPSSGVPVSAQSASENPTRRRTPKACGECRRLKLKCDRVFPCQSCVKRGCEGICPEGSLVSGRGSRYILANTEQLHEKIVQMADRIRELEEALRMVSEEHARCLNRSTSSSAPVHPLLREDLLLVKNQLELYGLDRSKSASRSESLDTNDGSEGGHSRHGNEQQLTPTSLETLFMGSSAQFLEPQRSDYTRGSSFSMPSQATLNAPFIMPQWSSDRRSLSQYHTEVHSISDNGARPQASYPYMGNAPAAMDYQLEGYRDSSHASQSVRDASAIRAETRRPSSASSAQIDSAYYYPSAGTI